MDGLTGQVLYQQNGAERNFPASTTKLLTAIVAVEHGKLDQKIHVSKEAVDKAPDSASCYISEGEEHPLEYLLYGLLLPSGNDCADAIAAGLTDGHPEQFVAWMNETAKRLGAVNSHFANPHGLHADNHYTTAADLAIIARTALNNPIIRKIAATREFVWPGKEQNGTYYNHNGMLGTYDGLIGGKTGFTEQAQFTLAVAAERKGRQLIGVTMGYESKEVEYRDMASLLDYGFDNFLRVDAVTAGSLQGEIQVAQGRVHRVPVMAESSFAITRPKDGPQKVTVVPKLKSEVRAPVAQGEQVGVLEVRDGEKVLGTVPLVTKESVDVQPSLWETFSNWAAIVLKWLVIVFAGLLAFRMVVKTIRRALRKHRRRSPVSGMRERATGTRGEISSYRPGPLSGKAPPHVNQWAVRSAPPRLGRRFLLPAQAAPTRRPP